MLIIPLPMGTAGELFSTENANSPCGREWLLGMIPKKKETPTHDGLTRRGRDMNGGLKDCDGQ